MDQSAAERLKVWLYSDGACSGNPGPGGWAYILRDQASGATKKASGYEPNTTNNRMELTAVIKGLEALKRPCVVTLVTDSAYVADGLKTWMPAWKARGWQRQVGKKLAPVKNLDLWQELDRLLATHELICERIAGHRGHPENEECDALAVAAYRQFRVVRPPDD